MRGTPEHPDGLLYVPDLVTAEEERTLLEDLERLELRTLTMHGQQARRRVRHYGYDYGYESWQLVPTDPAPPFLEPVRDRCAALVPVAPDELAQTLVTSYPAGATIGWHRDAPMFGHAVVGLSLAADCVMRFQRRSRTGERFVHEQPLAPRSAYVLAGPARWVWQHSIPAVPRRRYSVTFRTLRHPERWSTAPPRA